MSRYGESVCSLWDVRQADGLIPATSICLQVPTKPAFLLNMAVLISRLSPLLFGGGGEGDLLPLVSGAPGKWEVILAHSLASGIAFALSVWMDYVARVTFLRGLRNGSSNLAKASEKNGLRPKLE